MIVRTCDICNKQFKSDTDEVIFRHEYTDDGSWLHTYGTLFHVESFMLCQKCTAKVLYELKKENKLHGN